MKKLSLFSLFFYISICSFGQKTKTSVYSQDPKAIAKGKALFETNCASCHNFKQKGIGPNLAFVTNEMPVEWVKNAIINTSKLLKSFDKRATTLVQEYKQTMPSFEHLKDQDVNNLVAYIHSERKDKKATPIEGLYGRILPPIEKSKLKLKLEYINTAPATSNKIPIARINTMVNFKNRTFLSDLRGIIYEMKGKELIPYMDFQKLQPNFIHVPGLATGLGSYAFHPDFEENGLFYTSHAEKAKTAKADYFYNDSIKVALQWVILEWKVDNLLAEKFKGKPREIFRIDFVSQIHGMQEIAFKPNIEKTDEDYGLLFIGIGDGGASENGFPQICNSTKTPWSSVLRIDPKGNNSKNGKYGIPKSNPFLKPEDAQEVYCRGFRNPNRIYWTPDGKMLISDIGHKNVEEINIGKKGSDYGWPVREGNFVIDPFKNMDVLYNLPKNDVGYQYPSLQYDHEDGNAISAGFVYNENEISNLKGKYIFGDIVSGRVFYAENKEMQFGKQSPIFEFQLELNGNSVNFKDLCSNSKTDLRFGQGIAGEIYLYTKTDGKIYKIVGCE
ncbi:cytochrome C [Lacihabitans sp. LS3-19]|uniref:PQQ-dependent sugar dehydrogenase n=1 Tax=Lacihabitans sp. LS3-19 TaxID=2487335 RepID=UPI0020CB6EEB|nr:PQQ-dependent sugar dehydrogenase [Lacihabitans sp. LS3-19]MCP9769903.1 cytochrome C [Lacihabitans sp. LS3-19]